MNKFIILKDDSGFCGVYKNGKFVKGDYDITKEFVADEYDIDEDNVIVRNLTDKDNEYINNNVFFPESITEFNDDY